MMSETSKVEQEKELAFNKIIGSSDVMSKAILLARKGAKTDVPILISGQSGVGKEVFARAIHKSSGRSDEPFIVVNCGALPANLVESILFGHVRGAFTDAKEDHSGKFVDAHGGTIFLDEIGELPLDLQVKLLRVLQEGEVDPVGGEKIITVDVRVISATNKKLEDLVLEGTFREDLYYRLNVFPVSLPPLNKRKGDIQTLAVHFIQKICKKEKRDVKALTTNAVMLLNSYHWPGNVRQLENVVLRAVILSEGEMITDKDFPQIIADIERIASINKKHNRRIDDLKKTLEIPKEFHNVSIYDENADVFPIEYIEQMMIKYAFIRHKGKMTEIARRLKIGRSTLYRKVDELGLLEED
ncbi:MAG: sigma-54-dependent Fis family transcriptional regulator [Kordiimonadaceae bacterium]|nr:sigma-54-dependent Fis family transcriptional regulator [Kordiimonadaceae bacterium]MBT6330538.1 sigma-54-dependent Fis family transcriptional regulator [Kordiimonadaceae bacterium]MBT7582578.1 sigma-54-dependent Fis family transcriptional regulator [Kordiimonadaceae bacterium]